MRFPTFPTIVRTFYTLGNFSTRATTSYRSLQPLSKSTVLRSMPTIPFLSSLFSSNSSAPKMSYPLEKSDEEWQAVLSKGKSTATTLAQFRQRSTC